MLVLSRKESEQVVINGGFDAGGITISIQQIRGDKVRLGIVADKDVTVHRGEIQDIIDQKKGTGAA